MTREARTLFFSRSTRIGLPVGIFLAIIWGACQIQRSVDNFIASQKSGFAALYQHIDQKYWMGHAEIVDFADQLREDNTTVTRSDGRQGLIVTPPKRNQGSIQ